MRIDETRREHPSFAAAMTVVRDTPDELILCRRPGHAMKRRNAEHVDIPGFRHPRIRRWLGGWSDAGIWSRWRILLLMRPDEHHSISLFWDDQTGELDFWYVDLIGPVRRRSAGFDFPEHGLDVVVESDLSAWKWKDEDELEWAVTSGVYSRAEADELYAEGRRAVDRLLTERGYFERWRQWRPAPSWPIATLPPGWDLP